MVIWKKFHLSDAMSRKLLLYLTTTIEIKNPLCVYVKPLGKKSIRLKCNQLGIFIISYIHYSYLYLVLSTFQSENIEHLIHNTARKKKFLQSPEEGHIVRNKGTKEVCVSKGFSKSKHLSHFRLFRIKLYFSAYNNHKIQLWIDFAWNQW